MYGTTGSRLLSDELDTGNPIAVAILLANVSPELNRLLGFSCKLCFNVKQKAE